VPFTDEANAAAYRDAWEGWKKQIEQVHQVFLEGESLRPDALKGLLNRESRAWEKYGEARLKLLGLGEATPEGSANPFKGDNPFK
jgi:hypothetical protein